MSYWHGYLTESRLSLSSARSWRPGAGVTLPRYKQGDQS